MREKIIRAIFALLVFLFFWLGSARLGVALLGPEHGGIIVIAAGGMFIGIGVASEIMFRR